MKYRIRESNTKEGRESIEGEINSLVNNCIEDQEQFTTDWDKKNRELEKRYSQWEKITLLVLLRDIERRLILLFGV